MIDMLKRIKILAAVLSVLLTAGCRAATMRVSEEKKINLTFSFWEPGVHTELEDGLKKVINEYEKLHKNVHIELISVPVADYDNYIKERMVSGNLPDIQSNNGTQLEMQMQKGLIVDIRDELEKESAYYSGNLWKDTFEPKYTEWSQNPDKPIVGIPFFGVGIGIFYNKTMYERLGLSVPETWSEFMYNCEVIQNAGKQPIAFMTNKSDARDWLEWEVGAGLYGEADLKNRELNIDGDSRITESEIAQYIKNTSFDMTTDKEYQDRYKNYINHISQFLSYCTESADYEERVAKTVFLNGEAGHIHSGSWDVISFMKNPNVGFEVGVFEFPKFTCEDTPYPGDGVQVLSAQCLALTKSVNSESGKKETAVDFLQYLTSADVYRDFIGDTFQIPTVKGAPTDKDLECFINDEGNKFYSFMTMGDGDIIYDIIVGNAPVIDDKYFRNKMKNVLKYQE